MLIAGAQIDIQYGQFESNVEHMLEFAGQAKQREAGLVIFPECALSGYCCETIEEARSLALEQQNQHADRLKAFCREQRIHMVFGYLEKVGDEVFNSLSLMGPDGLVANYRKTHLPMLGVDRFTCPGVDAYEVIEIDGVRIGMLICYDCSFPEPTRILALRGADLIILPTNWPSGALVTSEVIPPARAMENHVYFAAVNRVGTERGFEFVGQSSLVLPNGRREAFADSQTEQLMLMEVDPKVARQKRLVRVPGKHEIDLIADRRPDLYGELIRVNESK